MFDDLPSLPDTLSSMPLYQQLPLGKYQDRTRRFWNQRTEWRLFARELEASHKHSRSTRVTEERAMMLLHHQGNDKDRDNGSSSPYSSCDSSGDTDGSAADLDVALFDRRWTQLEEAIQTSTPATADNSGRHISSPRRVALFELEPWAKRYETAIYTQKRDQLMQMLKDLQGQDDDGAWITRGKRTEILFEAHGAARCFVFGMARRIQRWWRLLHIRKVIKYNKHSWPQRMRERHFLKLKGGLFHRGDGFDLGRRSHGASDLASEDIANMTYAEAFMLRDDRTKPSGKYLRTSGGRISEAVPMSYLDWSVKLSKITPSPDYYQRPLKPRIASGGQFSTAYPQTEIEHIFAHGDETPGPAAYNPKPLPRLRGAARISDANPKSYIDWAIYYNKGTPGPSTYDISLCR
jgi:hypothetical protein